LCPRNYRQAPGQVRRETTFRSAERVQRSQHAAWRNLKPCPKAAIETTLLGGLTSQGSHPVKATAHRHETEGTLAVRSAKRVQRGQYLPFAAPTGMRHRASTTKTIRNLKQPRNSSITSLPDTI